MIYFLLFLVLWYFFTKRFMRYFREQQKRDDPDA